LINIKVRRLINLKLLSRTKKIILLLCDVVLINLSYILALYLRYDYSYFKLYVSGYLEKAVIISLIYLICFYCFRLYESLWKYASIDEFMLAIGGCLTGSLGAVVYGKIVGINYSYSIGILTTLLCTIFVVGFRMSFRIYRRFSYILDSSTNDKGRKRVMIIGAGSAAAMLIKEMKSDDQYNYKPVVLIDDNRYKIQRNVCGIKVLGNRSDIESIVKEKCIDIILIAIPSIEEENKRELLEICKKTNCKVQIVPGLFEIVNGRVSLNQIRDVNVEDLLGRSQVNLDMNGISEYIKGRNVLVTGGGGSIGSELCRQIVRFKPKELVIFDIYENNAYEIQNELKYKYPKLNLKVLIGSVRDKKRLDQVFKTYKPEVVFHAAAHKHVPLMEESPMEAIKNNVFGTLNTSECADKHGVKRFVLISTDKAVNPTNVMGATKRMCEMIIQSMDKISKTHFAAVRFGNVLGSNGSVIPLFKKQIAHGGPVTVTHKNITRFFMTIPEAAKLVLQAGEFAQGGEIFVLDMGKPVKIYDLAKDLIKLSGFQSDKDIKIEITGLRPGEKLYEELLMNEEGLKDTKHEKIFVGKPTFSDIDRLKEKFEELRGVIDEGDCVGVIGKIEEIVPTYVRNGEDEVAVGGTMVER
jgi:FlaA1/EpsC-like NDP-sugar epimerase